MATYYEEDYLNLIIENGIQNLKTMSKYNILSSIIR